MMMRKMMRKMMREMMRKMIKASVLRNATKLKQTKKNYFIVFDY